MGGCSDRPCIVHFSLRKQVSCLSVISSLHAFPHFVVRHIILRYRHSIISCSPSASAEHQRSSSTVILSYARPRTALQALHSLAPRRVHIHRNVSRSSANSSPNASPPSHLTSQKMTRQERGMCDAAHCVFAARATHHRLGSASYARHRLPCFAPCGMRDCHGLRN
jgi:hypothetical protein